MAVPAPISELELYDLENEADSTYKDLVQALEGLCTAYEREKADL